MGGPFEQPVRLFPYSIIRDNCTIKSLVLSGIEEIDASDGEKGAVPKLLVV